MRQTWAIEAEAIDSSSNDAKTSSSGHPRDASTVALISSNGAEQFASWKEVNFSV